MAIAGGTAPCLSLTWDPKRNIIRIGHSENRLLKVQVTETDPDTGKTTKRTVATGAAELDVDKAIQRLFSKMDKDGRPVPVWIRAKDRAEIEKRTGLETIPVQLIGWGKT